MNKQIVAGIIFFIIWIFVLLIWGASKNTIPDRRTDTITNPNNIEEYCSGGSGHPLDNCW